MIVQNKGSIVKNKVFDGTVSQFKLFDFTRVGEWVFGYVLDVVFDEKKLS